ncbi:DUF6933 domain-containing protein [Thalassobacillus pellis]|uniref:DUF6933 domain-containing protein n=1 Tax=Thalassobacillus pellis TaxID=748008 RepID=UPI001960CF3D|nr:hypothetical protein [Thalassobacillus pellis]MBM7551944.1 hypothetical protein [Thalassobacillus pellis]
MMQIAVTQKMAKELRKEIQPADAVDIPDIYRWHMNVFTFRRRKSVLLLNDATGLNMILLGLKREQFDNIDQVIMGSLRELLRVLEIDQDIIEDMMQAGKEIVYTKTHNRTAIGRMVELKKVCDIFYEDETFEQIDAVQLNIRNNEQIFLNLKHSYPLEAFKKYFEENK